jgi:hypothetical protein
MRTQYLMSPNSLNKGFRLVHPVAVTPLSSMPHSSCSAVQWISHFERENPIFTT